MTDYQDNEKEAIIGYYTALQKSWIPFDKAIPYKHWLIEVTSNPKETEAESIVRPISNNSGGDELWTHWRPITFSCEPINED